MWPLTVSQRLRLLERRITELRAWQNAFELPIPDWRITQPKLESKTIRLGQPWGFSDGSNGYNTHLQGTVILETRFEVPATFEHHAVELELDVGGEGLVQIVCAEQIIYHGGLNPYHRVFRLLERANGGESFEVRIEAVPKGLFGSRNDTPHLTRAHLIAPHLEVRALADELETLRQVGQTLVDHDAVPLLLAAAEDVLQNLDWISNTEDYHARLTRGAVGGAWERDILWSLPPAPELKPLESAVLQQVSAARARLNEHLDKLRGLFPPQGRIALTGHAHIDLAWLWPISETRRKLRRTFGTVLELMKCYPDFKFNQSSAQAYAWIEQDDPAMFEEIQARVSEGRWEPIGGMWVEPDGQMLFGESWARQLLYGQRYFKQKFGRVSNVAWLPDTFGFNPQLPQLLQQAGITCFFTTKLRWNETSQFPHDLFHWEGLDGSRVLAHCFWNPSESYNAEINPKSLRDVWHFFKGKHHKAWLTHDHAPQTLLSFGWGDGGGGPTREHLEGFERLKQYPAMPSLELTRVDDFYERFPNADLPVWRGELYLELHRGTLTTQSRLKKWHRQLEHRINEAEALQALNWFDSQSHNSPRENSLSTYPQAELEQLWITLLLHQFHDILPGSSIREVNEDAHRELEAALKRTTALRDEALKSRVLEILPEMAVAPRHTATGFVFENEHLYANIEMGQLNSLIDKATNRQLLSAAARLTWERDVPREWEAWDVNPPLNPQELRGDVKYEVLDDGMRVTMKWRDSSFEQIFRLRGAQLEIDHRIDWRERRILVRAEFPLNLQVAQTTYGTAFGAVSRPAHRNQPSDAAMFEVCAQGWADASEMRYGVSILIDAKYGFGFDDNTMRVSLLRGSMYPDPSADLGVHEFRLALRPHAGSWSEARVQHHALAFSSPALAALQTHFRQDGVELMLCAIKRAEDEAALIVRFAEMNGARGQTRIRLPGVIRAERVNLLEESQGEFDLQNESITLEVAPFQIISLQLWNQKTE